ncbi:hypothetical protein ACN955_000507 [Listeria monocytogenes]|uniref:hypothetical protein n=1 Tax=Listeria monocytogenes TaxID=1639 RepID=UPI000E6D1B83|nr:hypothetical protein [Listeria monocytogenes]EAA0393691.1 hypothetical protein [Listeria monocytogenes]EAC3600189.1 hypothetical protein [Listeria monocytogenes]EAC4295837.1 hypothetical protein [Listeria monocytogenes]EAC6286902.1 hypothetical protein [Listeria monocytogenes]EAC6289949.1 hypothetical protein [Listeria monocytogenes]
MMKYYQIEKGTKAYEYLDKIYNQDTSAFLDEVTKLIGFDANGHIGINREELIIQKSTLEELKPEWMHKFKRYQGEWMTPKVVLKELISSYAELRKKYNMDYEFMYFCINNRLAGGVKVIYDFNSSGFAYLESNRDVENNDFDQVSEIKYLERKAELLAFEIEQKKNMDQEESE